MKNNDNLRGLKSVYSFTLSQTMKQIKYCFYGDFICNGAYFTSASKPYRK